MKRLATIARIAVVVALSLASRPSGAWNFQEHRAICNVAFQDACALVKEQSVATARDADRRDRTRRLRVACDSTSIADAFGQACAVSGDLVDNPADLTSALGNARATNDIHYYTLALLNNIHFQPFSRREWQTRHETAINVAMDTSGDSENEALRFERALFLEAFAEHFLEDSFSAGHLGFNRAATSAADAKLFHDDINDIGLWVSAPDKMRWFTLGDGNLGISPEDGEKLDTMLSVNPHAGGTSPCSEGGTYSCFRTQRFDKKCGHLDETEFRQNYGSQIGRLRVECAATQSVQSMVYAFVVQKRNSLLDYYAFRQIPDAKADRFSAELKKQASDFAATISSQKTKQPAKPSRYDGEESPESEKMSDQLASLNSRENLPAPGAYTSLLYVRKAAHHSFDAAAKAHAIAWSPLRTFGTRVGGELGWSIFRNTPVEPTFVQLSIGVEILSLKGEIETGAFASAYLRSDVHKSENGFLRNEIALGGGISQLSYDRYWLTSSYRARLEIGSLIITPEIGPMLGWLDTARKLSWGGAAGISVGGIWRRYGGEAL